MNILNASNISKSYLDETLFDGIKITLNSGDIIGIVGRNGEGKTTLLNILSGLEKPTTGVISWKKELKLGYLNQIPNYKNNTNIYQCLKSVFQGLNAISKQLESIEVKMSQETENIDYLMSRYIEEALLDYEGTIIAVSHDKYFLNKLFNATYLLKDKSLKKYQGNYDYVKEKGFLD